MTAPILGRAKPPPKPRLRKSGGLWWAEGRAQSGSRYICHGTTAENAYNELMRWLRA